MWDRQLALAVKNASIIIWDSDPLAASAFPALPLLGWRFLPGVLDQSLVRGLIANRREIRVSDNFVGVREPQFAGLLQGLKSLFLVAAESAGSGQGEKDLWVVGSNLGGQRQTRCRFFIFFGGAMTIVLFVHRDVKRAQRASRRQTLNAFVPVRGFLSQIGDHALYHHHRHARVLCRVY